MEQIFSTFSLVVFLLFTHSTPTLSQGPAPAPALPTSPAPTLPIPPAPAPGPPAPTNVTHILEKAGKYTTFIRLLKITKVDDQLTSQLNNSNQGLTIFAPADDAFSNLKQGMLNSLNDEQKTELIQFHMLPTLLSVSQFETASNPLRTEAGGFEGQFPLNVTAFGTTVNITTDMVNASVADTIYTDDQLAVYHVDKVLVPHGLFVSPPPAPAPVKPKKHPATNPSAASATLVGASAGVRVTGPTVHAISSFVVVLAAFYLNV